MPIRRRYRPGKKYDTRLWKLRDDRSGFPILSKDIMRDGNKPELVVNKDTWEPFLNVRLPVPTIVPSIPDPARPITDPTLGDIEFCYVITNSAGTVVGVSCSPNAFWNRLRATDTQIDAYKPTVTDSEFIIAEGAPFGTAVGTVVATDPHSYTLSYSITDGNDAGNFEISATSGLISVASTGAALVEGDSFSLTVKAQQISGLSRLAATGTITVTVGASTFDYGDYGTVWINMDATASSSITLSGSRVTSWASNYPGTTTRTFTQSGTKPTYESAGLNSSPDIYFNGTFSTTEYLQYTGSASDVSFVNNSAATIHIVIKDSVAATRNIMGNSVGTTAAGFVINVSGRNVTFAAANGSASIISLATTGTVYLQGTPFVLTVKFDGTTAKIYTDGTLKATGTVTHAAGGTALTQLRLGATSNALSNIEARMGQILMYSTAQSDANLAIVVNHLKALWGIS